MRINYKELKEISNSMLNIIALVLILVVSIGSTLAMTPKSYQDILNDSRQKVKGISTNDAKAIKYESYRGTTMGMELQSYENKDGGYLSRIIISDSQSSFVNQGIVKVINESAFQKNFKVIFRSDPKKIQNYSLFILLNNLEKKIEINSQGYAEETFSVAGYSSDTLKVLIQNGYGMVKDLGIEIEVREI